LRNAGGVDPLWWTLFGLGPKGVQHGNYPSALSYPAEFKQQIVELYRSGRTPGQLAKEFEPTEVTNRHWITQADADEGHRPDVLTSVERDELRRLRRENKRLQTERDILAKATAWFARETDVDSTRSSRS
jgi:transposase